MRTRAIFVAMCVAALLTSCTSSGHRQSAYCTQLAATAHRLASAESVVYTGGTGSGAALSRIVTELHRVQRGAPAQIQTAIDDLVTAFGQAEQLLKRPTQQGRTQLAQVASRLSADGKTVGDYLSAKCPQR